MAKREEDDGGNMESAPPKIPVDIHLVSTVYSAEFTLMSYYIRKSTVVGLDAEWKPIRRGDSTSNSTSSGFPTVTVLQIACRCRPYPVGIGQTCVFVVDLMSIPAAALWEILKEMFLTPNVIKLGFRFKQDFVYLSSTFASQGCHPGFDDVVSFLDINNIYHHLKIHHSMKRAPKEIKSLATICKELLNVSLSKELQCSDWSNRPLTQEQVSYAAADAYYLLEIFDVFRCNISSGGNSLFYINTPNVSLGLKEILENSDTPNNILGVKFCQASDMVKLNGPERLSVRYSTTIFCPPHGNVLPGDSLSKIVEIYGERILLKESDRKPKISKKKKRKQPNVGSRIQDQNEVVSNWEAPPPWDPSLGGDGCPKFLCDVMVEGLAKQLRCVGFDAVVPSSKKPEPRLLINQAHSEKRVILTRDTKLLKHQYLIRNQVYLVKGLLKNEQLLEIIDVFQLKICEQQLLSRCTKCNGNFIQKSLSIEEAIEASKGFQIIPDCLFDKNLQFWQCMDCKQLYWEGTQYHNAIQKFINVCKLNE